MRARAIAAVLTVGVLLPSLGTAQVFVLPNPYPRVTAAQAPWYLNGQPIFHAGALYYPSGPSSFFDGDVMRRTGTYDGVPLYEDATLSPFSVVFVPIGGNVVRPYERRREGELAGTVGSRPPSFPIQRTGELPLDFGVTDVFTPPIDADPVPMLPETLAADAAGIRPVLLQVPPAAPAAPRHVVIGATPPSGTPDGVWIEFGGARWYSAGAASPFQAGRFESIGEHLGAPVYREIGGAADVIFVPAVENGPVAPYRRR